MCETDRLISEQTHSLCLPGTTLCKFVRVINVAIILYVHTGYKCVILCMFLPNIVIHN